MFFSEQSADSIIRAIDDFEKREKEFNPLDCRKNAERFSEDIFLSKIKSFVSEKTGQPII